MVFAPNPWGRMNLGKPEPAALLASVRSEGGEAGRGEEEGRGTEEGEGKEDQDYIPPSMALDSHRSTQQNIDLSVYCPPV